MVWNSRIAPALLAAALAPWAPHALAATINVTVDAPDELATNRSCSLREAIGNINAGADTYADCAATGAYGTNDTIALPVGTYATAIGGIEENDNAKGDYDIRANVDITGAGAASTVIDAAMLDRVFEILAPAMGEPYTVRFSGLTITRGADDPGIGGGVSNNGGMLTFTDVTITDNSAAYGGGLYNDGGTVTFTGATISANGGCCTGGGIYNVEGPLTILHSTISDNGTNWGTAVGGGIYSADADVTISNSTIAGNMTGGDGGAIYHDSVDTTKLFKIENSTISGNTANKNGGGIFNSTSSILAMTNSTISGNRATLEGGGLYNQSPITIAHVTFADNTALGGTSDPVAGSGGALVVNGADAAVTFSHTLVDGECRLDGGAILSSGHNLDTDGSCFAGSGNDTDLISATANLGTLADNGGPTGTHALRKGSAAIDAGDCAGGTVDTDQRGVARPQGSACDIGAFELVPASGDDTGGGDTGGGSGSGGGGGSADTWLMLLLAMATGARRTVAAARGVRSRV